MLTVAVLGPLEVTRDGVPIVIPAGRTTEVLIRLALSAGELVRTDELIDDIWGGTATGTRRNTVQSKISQLRRVLGDPGVIRGRSDGYILLVPVDGVDALRVGRLAAAAASLTHAGRSDAASETAADALALFRGAVLTDAGGGAWSAPYRGRLEELCLVLLGLELAARVEGGGGGEVIARLQNLVEEHPLREDLWASLITALYRNGRQADALAAYARVRRALVAELGIEPGPLLRSLEQQVLRQSLPVNATAAAPGTVLAAGNLPGPSSPMVGRAADLAALRRTAQTSRLVTVVGPAGVGKTRLTIELARLCAPAGGAWLVRLDTVDAGSSVRQFVAGTLGLADETVLSERVRAVETLIVLDNCEHVIGAAAELALDLLDAAPSVRIMATSQLPLRVSGEAVHLVEPLPLAASVELFAIRAGEVLPRFDRAEEDAAVQDVCGSLDGLPLAIELAAARVKSLSVREIARRLPDRFTVLRDPMSRLPQRRRALDAAIEWSYDLLFPDDQRGLWALSCFSGPAPLAAAEHVLQALGVPEAAALDVIARLVDRSLVSVVPTGDGEVDYRLLDSIRAYAGLRLREAGAADAAGEAHARWFAGRADRCAAAIRGPGQLTCVTFVRDQRANIDTALSWAADHAPRVGLRIANGYAWTWVVLGEGVAGAARLRAALAAAAAAPLRERVRAQLVAGWLEASAGNLDRAGQDLQAAAAGLEDLDDAELTVELWRTQVFVHLQRGRPVDAVELADRAVAECRAHRFGWAEAGTLLLAASAHLMLGDTDRARRDAEQAAVFLERLDDSWLQVHAAGVLGAIAQAEHRFGDAAALLATAATLAQHHGFLGQQAYHASRLGQVQQQAGDPAAATTLGRAVDAAVHCGDLRMAATARLHLADLHRTAGRLNTAAVLLRQNSAWYDRAGGGDGSLMTRCLLAMSPPTSATLRVVLTDATSAGDLHVQVIAGDALALMAAQRGDTAGARSLLGTADALMPSIGHLLGEQDRADASATHRYLDVVT